MLSTHFYCNLKRIVKIVIIWEFNIILLKGIYPLLPIYICIVIGSSGVISLWPEGKRELG